MKCVNRNLPDYKQLKGLTGLSDIVLSAKVSAWQDKNNTDRIPTTDELGIFPKDTFEELDSINVTHGEMVDLGDSVYYKVGDVDLTEANNNLPFGDRLEVKERPNGDKFVVVRNNNEVHNAAMDALNKKYERELNMPFETQNKENPLDELPEEAAEQVSYFTDLVDVDFEIDNDLKDDSGRPVAGVLVSKNKTKNNKPLIKLNPSLLKEDTVAHEISHLFIDMVGGLENGRIKAAVNKLKTTDLYARMSETLSGEKLDKEVLAIALGREVSSLFKDENNKTWWNEFVDWLFNLLGIRMGLPANELQELAQEIYKGNIKVNFDNLSSYDQFQYDSSEIYDEVQTLETILEKASQRLEVILDKWTKENATNSKRLELIEASALMKDEIDRYLGVQNARGILALVQATEFEFENIEEGLNKEDISSFDITTLKQFKNSFDLINQINILIEREPEVLDDLLDEEKDTVRQLLGKLIKKEQVLSDEIKRKSLIIMSKKMSKLSNIETVKASIKYEQEFIKNNPKGSTPKDEYNRRKLEYIDKKLEENKEEIKKRQDNLFYRQLKTGIDIGGIKYILDSGQVNSRVIQIVQKILDRADFETASYMVGRRNEVKELYDEFVSLFGSELNQQKMYEKFINNTENGLYLLTKYRPEYYEELTELNIKVHQAKIQGNKKEFDKLVKERKAWHLENSTPLTEDTFKPKDIWLDENYKNLSSTELQFLDKLKAFMLEDDKSLFDSQKLSDTRLGFEVFKLPQVNKSLAQRFFENNLSDFARQTVGSLTKVEADDLELDAVEDQHNRLEKSTSLFTESFVNIDNTEANRIPVFFRRPVEKSDRSNDLFTLVLLNSWSSENFRQKFAASADVELISELLNEKKYVKHAQNRLFLSKKFRFKDTHIDNKLIADPTANNEKQMLRSIMDHRLYGIGEVSRMVGNISLNKVSSNINQLASASMLMLNYFAAVPNFMMGQSMNYIEAGGSLYNDENLKRAHRMYWEDAANFMNDIGSTNPSSKTTLLLDLFEIMNSVSSIKNKFVDDGSIRAIAKKDTLYFLSHGTEHYNQAVMMYAILDSIEYKGKPLSEQITAEKGKLLINGEDIKQNKELHDILFKARVRTKKVIADNHGQYDDRMKSEFQREFFGKTVMMLRKWILRGVTRRFKGAGRPSIYEVDEDVNIDMVFFSEESDLFEEGNYVTAIRFLNNLRKDFMNRGLDVAKNWNNLTDYEKSNIVKTMREMALITLYLTSYIAINKMAEGESDDELKNAYYMGAYYFRRTSGELMFYLNPSEMITIMRTPAATLNYVEKLGRVLSELDFERYERSGPGYEKGELKLIKRLEDVSPVVGQIFRYQEAEDILSYHTK